MSPRPGDPYDQMPDGLRVKNALRAYEKYQEETTGTTIAKTAMLC